MAMMLITLIASMFILITIIDFKRKKAKNGTNNVKSTLKLRSKKKAEGIVFGKKGWFQLACSPSSAEGHLAVFGGSGSGKTSALLIPTLRAWQGSAFVVDISGDISANVQKSTKVIFDPENANTTPYDVFYAVDNAPDLDERNNRLKQITFALLPEVLQDNGTSKYYRESAREMLQAGFIAYYDKGLDFVDICKQMTSCSPSLLIDDIRASGNDVAVKLISSLIGIPEGTLSGIKQEADKAISLFATNKKLEKALRRAKKSISPALLEKRSVYIRVADEKLEIFAPLMRLIMTQTFSHLSARPNNANLPILLCLDEFASFGQLEILPALRKLRKKKVRVMLLTQSLADLDLIYGISDRRAMLDNLLYKVVLSASEPETQTYFSKLAGEKTVTRSSVTRGQNGISESKVDIREHAIYPEEFGRLGDNLILFHPAGVERLRKNFYYK